MEDEGLWSSFVLSGVGLVSWLVGVGGDRGEAERRGLEWGEVRGTIWFWILWSRRRAGVFVCVFFFGGEEGSRRDWLVGWLVDGIFGDGFFFLLFCGGFTGIVGLAVGEALA